MINNKKQTGQQSRSFGYERFSWSMSWTHESLTSGPFGRPFYAAIS
jgi:hypothetical protein